ncbi:DUF5955 family protein [Streptomyces sp. NPDC088354]|uniref:DUF5955 family protein n=2 Tax=unclassified Streptomyces TaxID=2593676 RepID=UPI00382019F0
MGDVSVVKDMAASAALDGDGAGDPRVAALHAAVSHCRRVLAGYRSNLPDRHIAEDELVALASAATAGVPDVPRLRRGLLVLTGALGSVSALSAALTEVRRAIELFGAPSSAD